MTTIKETSSLFCGQTSPGETWRYRNWSFPVQSSKFGVFITFQQHAHQLYAGLFTEGVDKPAPDQKCCPTICSNAFSADMPSRINWLISCETLLMPRSEERRVGNVGCSTVSSRW